MSSLGCGLQHKVSNKRQSVNNTIWSVVFVILYQTLEELSLGRDNVTQTCKVNDFGRFMSHQYSQEL